VWAIHRVVAAPSVPADLTAIILLVVAFLARTEFLVLALVLPLAIVAVELTASLGGSWPTSAVALLRTLLSRHRVLVVAYACVLLSVLGFVAAGGHPLDLSAYGQKVPAPLVPPGFTGVFLGYIAQFAFSLGLLPFIVGSAWLFANTVTPGPAGQREARAFAWVASLSFVLLTAEVAKYSLGFGAVIYERFVFYFAPIVMLAIVLAVLDRRWPRRSVIVPLVLVCAGFALRLQAPYAWRGGRVNPDTPVSLFYHPLLEVLGSRGAMKVGLICVAVLLTGVFVLAGRARNRKPFAAVFVTLSIGLLAAETGYVYVRMFRMTSYSERPLTAPIPSGLSWVDATVGQDASVTVVPFHVSTDYWVNLEYWRDIEFWNKSVDRSAQYQSTALYDFTGTWFPKLTLAFNPTTGLANMSPTRYVVQSVGDSRFQVAGNVTVVNEFGQLIDAERPWHAAFITLGAYDDGWMKPHTPATIRVFPARGQRQPRLLYLNLQFWAPANVSHRAFTVRSNVDDHSGKVSDSQTTFVNALAVCVPASGYADVSIRSAGFSTIPGDLSNLQAFLGHRLGSIHLADASVSNDIGPVCHPRRRT
jgi:hypothetical protein